MRRLRARRLPWTVSASALTLLSLGAVTGQQTSSSTVPTPITIAGHVLSVETQAPIRGAIVAIDWGRTGWQASFLTGNDGRFVITGVTRGSHVIAARKPGYFAAYSGRSGLDGAPVPFDLSPDSPLGEVVIKMWPAATVSGVVRDAAGLPVHDITITAVGTQGPSVDTDAGGRYVVGPLRAGDYVISAQDRYHPNGPGVRAPVFWPAANQPSEATRLTLLWGQQRSDIEFTLEAPAAGSASGCQIEGRVVDDAGDPMEGSVSAFPSASVGQDAQASVQTVKLDMLGRYCLAGLPPGAYVVRANGWLAEGALHVFDAAGRDRRVARLPTFYPDTASSAAARPLTLSADTKLRGIDLVVSPTPVTRIVLRLDSAGRDVLTSAVSVTPTDERLGVQPFALQVNPGEWMIDNVVAGRYAIVVSATESIPIGPDETRPRLWASDEVNSDGTTPIECTLRLEDGARISGRIVFRGASPRPATPFVGVLPTEADRLRQIDDRGVAAVAADGTFMIDGIRPGLYVLNAADERGESAAWTLESATVAGRDALDVPIDLASGNTGDIVLTLSDRQTALAGRVTDADGRPISAPLLLFSADRRHWWPRSRRVISTHSAADGRYRIRNAPAGEYWLAVLREDELGEVAPSALQTLVPFSVRIVLPVVGQAVRDVQIATNRR